MWPKISCHHLSWNVIQPFAYVKEYYKDGCKISIMTRIEDINLDLGSFLPKEKSCIDMVRVFLTYENEITPSGSSGMSITKLKKCKEIVMDNV